MGHYNRAGQAVIKAIKRHKISVVSVPRNRTGTIVKEEGTWSHPENQHSKSKDVSIRINRKRTSGLPRTQLQTDWDSTAQQKSTAKNSAARENDPEGPWKTLQCRKTKVNGWISSLIL